jgi:hypothetical protein
MKKTYTIYGPVQLDCVNDYYQVIGPRDGVKSTWYTKTAAIQETKRLNAKVK